MNPKQLFYVTTTLLLGAFLSACSGSATVASSWPGLLADDKRVYLANNQHVYAIDLATGMQVWRFPTEPNPKITFFAAPNLSADGQLIVGGYDNVLYSLNPETGAQLWSFAEATNRYIGSPLVFDDLIFAPNAGNELFALDSQGKKRWSFESQGAHWVKPVSDPECKCIFLSSMDHRIYSIDAQTGNLNWQTDDLGGSIVGTPAYDPDGVLYVGTFASEILAINARNGAVLWRTPTTGWVWGGPVLAEDRLYFGDLSGAFYAVGSQAGEILWKIQSDGPISDSPLVSNDTIYFNTEAGSLYAIKKDGSYLWPQARPIGGKLYTSPVMAGETLLVAPVGGEAMLYALDANGNQKWTFIPSEK